MKEILTEAVQLGEGFWYNVLPVGKFHDPRYGRVAITPTLVKKLASSFGTATAYPPPVKIGHGDGAASPGIIKEVRAESDGLHVSFELDQEAAKDVKSGRYRYLSAEFVQDYTDKETGKKIGPALLGVALVNQPGHPDVKPIQFAEGEWVQEEEEKVPEQNTDRVHELEVKLAEMEKEKAEVKRLADESADELKRVRYEKRVAEVNAFCDKAVADGVPPAIVNKIKPVLLSESANEVITLSEGGNTRTQEWGVFLSELLEAVPRVNLGSAGVQVKPEDAVLAQVERVAARVNGKRK